MKTKTLSILTALAFTAIVASGQTPWYITGNGGTVDGTNFIGTTDNKPFNIRVNNIKSGRIDQTLLNTFFGYGSGSSTTGTYNTAFGNVALFSNTSGVSNSAIGANALYTNTTGNNNTATGYYALYTNGTGTGNTATGSSALSANNAGNSNTANGIQALVTNNSGSYNTAEGAQALNLNTSGQYNTANGASALYATSTGGYNTASGAQALYSNTFGSYNTAVGFHALYNTSTLAASYNTALGYNAGTTNTTGNNNTFIGYNTGATNAAWFNTTAIGNGAIVQNASNSIQIGDAAVTYCRIGVGAITFVTSDGRFKSNVNEQDVKGLEFIKRLRPVSYNYESRKMQEFTTKNMPENLKKEHMNKDFGPAEAIRHSGFIAQEVEKAANESGYNFDGLHKPENEDDTYALGYAQFVVPLVKAVQEQQKMIEELQEQVKKLTAVSSKNNNGGTTSNIALSDKNTIVLEQNAPNPFAEQTTISYFLPDNIQRAEIIISNQSGKVVKSVQLTEKGNGVLNVFAGDLSSGTFTYSLVIDGQTVETKKMIKTK